MEWCGSFSPFPPCWNFGTYTRDVESFLSASSELFEAHRDVCTDGPSMSVILLRKLELQETLCTGLLAEAR